MVHCLGPAYQRVQTVIFSFLLTRGVTPCAKYMYVLLQMTLIATLVVTNRLLLWVALVVMVWFCKTLVVTLLVSFTEMIFEAQVDCPSTSQISSVVRSHTIPCLLRSTTIHISQQQETNMQKQGNLVAYVVKYN